ATAPCSTPINHKGSQISYSATPGFGFPTPQRRASARVPPPNTARRFTTLRPAPRKNNDGAWTGTFYRSRLARLQCSTLPAGSGLRDGGIDAGIFPAEYWRVIERATDEQ